MNPPTVAVIGLGKVGLPLAAALASRGLSVRGFDPDPGRRALLRSHDPAQPEIRYERGLSEALRSSADRLRPADTVAEAVADAAVALVIVPTPSLADGRFCNAAVASAFRAIGESGTLPDGLVVNLVSTVSPGAIGTELQPLLEATAKGKSKVTSSSTSSRAYTPRSTKSKRPQACRTSTRSCTNS